MIKKSIDLRKMIAVVNSYDVCDYIMAFTPSDDYYKKAKRK